MSDLLSLLPIHMVIADILPLLRMPDLFSFFSVNRTLFELSKMENVWEMISKVKYPWLNKPEYVTWRYFTIHAIPFVSYYSGNFENYVREVSERVIDLFHAKIKKMDMSISVNKHVYKIRDITGYLFAGYSREEVLVQAENIKPGFIYSRTRYAVIDPERGMFSNDWLGVGVDSLRDIGRDVCTNGVEDLGILA